MLLYRLQLKITVQLLYLHCNIAEHGRQPQQASSSWPHDTDGATLTHSMHTTEVKLAEAPSLHSIMLAREIEQQQWQDGHADLAMPLNITDLGETIDGVGGIVPVTDYQFDMETLDLCNKVSVFAIAPINGHLLASRAINEENAKQSHRAA